MASQEGTLLQEILATHKEYKTCKAWNDDLINKLLRDWDELQRIFDQDASQQQQRQEQHEDSITTFDHWVRSKLAPSDYENCRDLRLDISSLFESLPKVEAQTATVLRRISARWSAPIPLLCDNFGLASLTSRLFSEKLAHIATVLSLSETKDRLRPIQEARLHATKQKHKKTKRPRDRYVPRDADVLIAELGILRPRKQSSQVLPNQDVPAEPPQLLESLPITPSSLDNTPPVRVAESNLHALQRMLPDTTKRKAAAKTIVEPSAKRRRRAIGGDNLLFENRVEASQGDEDQSVEDLELDDQSEGDYELDDQSEDQRVGDLELNDQSEGDQRVGDLELDDQSEGDHEFDDQSEEDQRVENEGDTHNEESDGRNLDVNVNGWVFNVKAEHPSTPEIGRRGRAQDLPNQYIEETPHSSTNLLFSPSKSHALEDSPTFPRSHVGNSLLDKFSDCQTSYGVDNSNHLPSSPTKQFEANYLSSSPTSQFKAKTSEKASHPEVNGGTEEPPFSASGVTGNNNISQARISNIKQRETALRPCVNPSLVRTCFQPNTMLNDEAVFYSLRAFATKDFRVLDPIFFSRTQLCKETPTELDAPKHGGNARFWLIPFHHLECLHWILVVCDRQTGVQYSLNSLLRINSIEVFKKLTTTCFQDGRYILGKGDWKYIQLKSPQQHNGHDCGIYVITNAISFMAGLSMPFQPACSEWRVVLKSLLCPAITSEPIRELDPQFLVLWFQKVIPQVQHQYELAKEALPNIHKAFFYLSTFVKLLKSLRQPEAEAQTRKIQQLNDQFKDASLLLSSISDSICDDNVESQQVHQSLKDFQVACLAKCKLKVLQLQNCELDTIFEAHLSSFEQHAKKIEEENSRIEAFMQASYNAATILSNRRK